MCMPLNGSDFHFIESNGDYEFMDGRPRSGWIRFLPRSDGPGRIRRTGRETYVFGDFLIVIAEDGQMQKQFPSGAWNVV